MNTNIRENFQRLIAAVKALPATPTAVAHPSDESSLAGALDAAKLGIITPILVGPRKKILAAASAATHRGWGGSRPANTSPSNPNKAATGLRKRCSIATRG